MTTIFELNKDTNFAASTLLLNWSETTLNWIEPNKDSIVWKPISGMELKNKK